MIGALPYSIYVGAVYHCVTILYIYCIYTQFSIVIEIKLTLYIEHLEACFSVYGKITKVRFPTAEHGAFVTSCISGHH